MYFLKEIWGLDINLMNPQFSCAILLCDIVQIWGISITTYDCCCQCKGLINIILFLIWYEFIGNGIVISSTINFNLYSWFTLTHPMLRLLSPKARERKDFWKPSKTCNVCTSWIVLMEYSQMSTKTPGVQYFFSTFALFCIGQLSHRHAG